MAVWGWMLDARTSHCFQDVTCLCSSDFVTCSVSLQLKHICFSIRHEGNAAAHINLLALGGLKPGRTFAPTHSPLHPSLSAFGVWAVRPVNAASVSLASLPSAWREQQLVCTSLFVIALISSPTVSCMS